jgi:hypothetical protein
LLLECRRNSAHKKSLRKAGFSNQIGAPERI